MESCYSRDMVILHKRLLTEFARQGADLLTAISMWADRTSQSKWKNRAEMVIDYPTARFISGSIVLFKLENAPAVITAQVAFNTGLVFVLSVSQQEVLS